MATPPFSGSDYILPIGPSSYINDIEANFALTKTELLSLYAQVQSGVADASFFDAGILEINGHFQLTRLLNKRVQYQTGAETNYVWTSQFFDLIDGVGLGYTSVNYSYHPTQAVGWYIAKELMLAANDFGQFTGTDEDIFTLFLKADTRYDNPASEDAPVFYQPASFHLPRHRWAGKDLTVRLKYKCDVSQAARLYGRWSGGANGLQKMTSGSERLEDTGGDWRTILLAVRPDADALYFEFGLEIESTNAMQIDIEYFILTDSPNRYAGGEKSAAMLALQTSLGQRYYCQFSALRTPGAYTLNPVNVLATGAMVQDILPFSQNQQMLAPGENIIFGGPHFDDPGLWPLVSTYSKEALAWSESLSPLPGLGVAHPVWHRVDNGALISVRPRVSSISPPAGYNPTLAEDMRQHYAAVVWEAWMYYVVDATDLRNMVPCCPTGGFAEAINNFPPLFS